MNNFNIGLAAQYLTDLDRQHRIDNEFLHSIDPNRRGRLFGMFPRGALIPPRNRGDAPRPADPPRNIGDAPRPADPPRNIGEEVRPADPPRNIGEEVRARDPPRNGRDAPPHGTRQ
jgi:hypothetical protein